MFAVYLEVVVRRVTPMYSCLYYTIVYNNSIFVTKEGTVILISSKDAVRAGSVLNARIQSSEERFHLEIYICCSSAYR